MKKKTGTILAVAAAVMAVVSVCVVVYKKNIQISRR